MRKAFVFVASLAMLAFIAPVTPSVAAQAASVPEVIKVSAPPGANQACPKNTVKVFMATVNVRRGHIVRPGTFTLVMKNGSKRTEKGSVVAGTKRHTAEYFLFVGRNARIKTGSVHTFRLRVNNDNTLFSVRLTEDCLEKAE